MTQHATTAIYDVLVVGAGISGIGLGIRLKEADIDNFVILEKADDLGGTWRDNTYPGCACDVPSALYSYSFAQKPDWSRAFAGQAEILDYVRDTAQRHHIQRHIRFNQAVERAQWREEKHLWEVQTADQLYLARTVVACSGYLHEPIVPAIPGLKDFTGTLFHSSRWDHHHDLNGERVAVIGTGASAIQFVPQIQPQVKHLTLFQRTPQWVLPKPDHAIPKLEENFFRLPFTLNAWRKMLFGGFETFGIGFRRPALLRQIQKLGEAHIRLAIKDPALRKTLTPDYTLGCKRVLMSNNYYPALNQPNVDVFATGLKEVRGNTLVGQDGSECQVDTIILGTGFFVTEPPIADHIFNNDGESLSQMWKDGMQAYRGTTISGLPNAFMVLGPNLGIGHNSAFIVIEAQINYIISTLTTMRERQLSRVEVKDQVQKTYNRKVQKDLQGTVWNTGGCSSYYLDKNGFNSVGFPWSTLKMQRLLREFDADSYTLTPATAKVF
ncbi:cyclohexanone monooxygenase [Alcanivorax hongdengensis A-11-3]|uniref:Cyclohexanone monooxygenase n=1 Tax=Alcanivorax hongdengensis A-11-3 TaxID=1177179 RepID=L0W7Q4_9GAMM|nr:NAD(P)/FAD-dependent oxidoreductase [Alcanivorax hongdengensis]EKF72911.1 cyclohexanone monooxygenase [Alcanivorax hongdengensis A-11-3]